MSLSTLLSLFSAQVGQETVVTSARAERRSNDSTVATEVITRATIEDIGAENLSDVLEESPNVQIDRTLAGPGVRLQGLDPKYVLILIDGERVTGRVDGTIDLSRIPAEAIERVEIVRGPASALYGADAIGGVINVITRKQRKPVSLEGHAAAGSIGTFDVTANGGARLGEGKARVIAGYHRGAGYDLDPSDVATNGPAFDTFNVEVSGGHPVRGSTELTGRAEYLQRQTARVDMGAGGAVFDRLNRTETVTTTAGSRTAFSDTASVKISAHYTLFRDQFAYDQRGSDALDQYQTTWNHLGQLSAIADVALPKGHQLTAGLEGFAEAVWADRLSTGWGRRFRGALFGQDEWKLPVSRPLVVSLGLRGDVDSQFGGAISPRLAVRFDPHDAVTLRAGAGLGFRAPDFRELLLSFQNPGAGYVIDGNPSLRPENSRSVNAAVEWRSSRLVVATLNLFHNELTDLIQNTLAAGEMGSLVRYTYSNVASAFTQGLESSLRVSPGPWFSAEASYSFLRAIDRSTGLMLDGRAAHRASLELGGKWFEQRLQAVARSAFTGPRGYVLSNDDAGAPIQTISPGYLSLDVRASYAVATWLKVFAMGENLFNAGEARLLPLQPRTFTAGFTATY